MNGPLTGIRVIDWTIWQLGPVAGTMLGDLGAEVIKLEERERGDPGRGIASIAGIPTAKGNRNFYMEITNRHKKSLALNLKRPEAREIVYKLVAKSDVFVQNLRKGVAARLGLDYKTLSVHNPRLIYASASGYGPLGPDSGEPAFDYLGQARSGIMNSISAANNPPAYIYGGVADGMGAVMLAYGIVVALLARERLGVGQEIDTSHLAAMMALQSVNVSARTIVGTELPHPAREEALNPLWNHYRCADGKWICLGMLQSDRYWRGFCAALGLGELIDDRRFADGPARSNNARELVAILDRTFARRPRHEWLAVLREGGDFVYTVVNTVSDLPDDQQVLANDYLVDYEHPDYGKSRIFGMPIRLSKTPGEPRGHAPELGEHTESILTELLGYSWDQIAELREVGAL